MDSIARLPSPDQLRHFWWTVWPEAARDFSRGGIELQTTDGPGEVRRSPGDQPIFVGLRRGVVNLVLTDHIPMKWDSGRALAGITTIQGGYHVCLIALQYAHGNQVPRYIGPKHLRARAFARADAGRLRNSPNLVPDRRSANSASIGTPPGSGYSTMAPPFANRPKPISIASERPSLRCGRLAPSERGGLRIGSAALCSLPDFAEANGSSLRK